MGTLFDILAEQGYNETDMPYKAVEYYTSVGAHSSARVFLLFHRNWNGHFFFE